VRYRETMRFLMANWTSSALDLMPNSSIMLYLWNATVLGVILRIPAISFHRAPLGKELQDLALPRAQLASARHRLGWSQEMRDHVPCGQRRDVRTPPGRPPEWLAAAPRPRNS
jgi:hypothetical protein